MTSDHKILRIAYIGGGSRFVVTLLHGLAERVDSIRSLGARINLVLMDPDLARAGEMANYAAIVAGESGLDLHTFVTDDLTASVQGADWVLYSVGLWERMADYRRRLEGIVRQAESDSGVGIALESAVYWSSVASVAEAIRQHAPGALFSTLANPTDVLAEAVEQRYGIRSVGICVEVPQLRRWLALHLGVPKCEIEFDYLGVNHIGYVTRFRVSGRPGLPILRERLPERMARKDWDPYNDTFANLVLKAGVMRDSPYHPYPYRRRWTQSEERQRQRFVASQQMSPAEYRRFRFAEAMKRGRMIAEDDDGLIKDMVTPYTYPDTRHTLGAIAVGLVGGSSEPVPLQVVNRGSVSSMPEDVRLELPTTIVGGELHPQPVGEFPVGQREQIRLFACQHALVARWLATGDNVALKEALLLSPDDEEAEALIAFGEKLESIGTTSKTE